MTDFLIWVRGDRESGMGHVMREMRLAEELLARHHTVTFEVLEGTPGYERIASWLSHRKNVHINDYTRHPDAIILDVENGPGRAVLEDARRRFRRVIVVGGVGFPIHDQSAIDELVDLQIYQSVIVTNPISCKNSVSGAEYVIIGKDYLTSRHVYGSQVFGNNILVVMGGGDPHGITGVVANAAKMCQNGYGVHVVYGPAANMVKTPPGVTTFLSPPSLSFSLSKARVAVTALGMTTYEAACIGVPTASVCWSEDHSRTADELERLGITTNLGMWDAPDWKKMQGFIERMHDEGEWRRMHEAGRKLVDGQGVRRVVDAVERIL